MTQYRPGTAIPFTDEEYIDQTLSKLARIAKKGEHGVHFTLYVREIKSILTELVKECRLNRDREIKSTLSRMLGE